ncbi:sensor histidine kinase [Pseudomonas aeruginosa]|uniref:sensor histidine kinase n=1 Tax=Pseudomonas aeruginosa TaxID=287 RepID=UPI000E678149|nr:sensor histidine kinase [Pseudomonas aeruginosa]MBA5106222.1 sensor histidine kinase [Pseudomonas aeruginosa]MBD1300248.1 sensor histidine kinase [Pseudomonas aeruginosa]MBD1340769.1 sensor histidine kinase [Pseudomonas aeruginosa]MBG6487284.1 sensor histidine kinase [Pseudomonas aeruginosa]MBH3592989.1 sensor histidine kinase [Pseudomonas aeruginosa]
MQLVCKTGNKSTGAPGPTRNSPCFALSILLNNLVDNAIRHAPGSTVNLSIRREGQNVILEVSDDGPGIPEAEHGRVLERFFWGQGEKLPEGSGLGLSIVAKIAEQHRAGLILDSGAGGRGLSVRLNFRAFEMDDRDGR